MTETERVRGIYDWHSRFYDKTEDLVERMLFSKWRKKYLSLLKGKILEVGVGTGKNLKYYNKNAKVTGIDFSQGMLNKAIEKSNKLDKNITLLKMDAQQLDFPDNHFDYVITTFVLCSIPDPVKGLREMKRVLKADGYLISLEHVLSTNLIIALFEHLHNPITRYLFGFNVNRNTLANIEKAGFVIDEDTHLKFGDVFRKFKAKK